MTRLEFFRNRFSMQTNVILLTVLLAPLVGVSIASAQMGNPIFLLFIGVPIGAVLTLYAPYEGLVLAGILGTMLADTRLVPSGLVYYGRFIPMAMLTMRAGIDIVVQRRDAAKSSRVILVPGLLFALLAGGSTLYSLTPEQTGQRALSMALVVIGLGLGLPTYLNTESLERLLKMVIVLIAGFVLVGAIATYGSSSGTLIEGEYIRIRGYFINPNTQGLMAMLVFFPLAWWWQMEKGKILRWIMLAAVIIFAGMILVAGSRASFLGIVAGAAVLGLSYGRNLFRYAPLIIIGIILLVVVSLYVPQFGRVLQLDNPETVTAPMPYGALPQVDRPFLIQRAIELGMRSPILGVGFGASDKVFADDVPYLQSIGIYIAGSHNSYTRMFVDLGVVGLLSGFWVFILVLAGVSLATSQMQRDPTVAFMTATVVAGLVNAFFEDWLFGFGNSSTLPLWFFLALIPIRLTQLNEESVEAERMNAPVIVETTT